MAIRIPRAVYDAIRAHGEEKYPDECCGALLGRAAGDDWEITAIMPAQNIRARGARRRYEIAPAELVTIIREARRQGLEVAGFYHSHPDGRAQWSEIDLAEAHWIGASYVISGVDHGKATETCSFLLAGSTEEDKRFERQSIELMEQ